METKNISKFERFNMKTKNDLNTVIKAFNKVIKIYPKDSIESNYYRYIIKYLLLEHKYKDIVERAGKPILHYFEYQLPQPTREYFEFLYHTYNPVRFAIETFDSIEEIRNELNR